MERKLMLIGFVGCPSSGKTTTAALVFAKLKSLGVPAEFVPEQARLHIAERRVEKDLQPEDKLVLTDNDQIAIMERQVHLERVMLTACGGRVVVVADSSPLNSLLYMTPECREYREVKELAARAVEHTDMLFYCPPLGVSTALDPNRVHDQDASLVIDKNLPWVMKQYAPEMKLSRLDGDSESRQREVIRTLMEKAFSC